MSWYFDPIRVTQAASYLLACSGQNRMPYLKLLRLLYMADQESLRETERPITGDDALATDYGPVLSRVYDYIQCMPRKGAHEWARFFHADGYDVERFEDPGASELSPYDERILKSVYDHNAHLDSFDTRLLSQEFPEWEKAYRGEGTTLPISLELRLEAVGIQSKEALDAIRQARDAECVYFEGMQELKDGLEHRSGRVLSA